MTYVSKPRWHHWLGIGSFFIVLITNYFTTKDGVQSFFRTLLDFDTSLKLYIQGLMTKAPLLTQADMLLPIVIILAHLGIFVYIFFLLFFDAFDRNPIMAIVFWFIGIFALHVVHYVFIDRNPFTFNSLWNLIPGSSILYLLSNFAAIKPGAVNTITELVTNTTNLTVENYNHNSININLE